MYDNCTCYIIRRSLLTAILSFIVSSAHVCNPGHDVSDVFVVLLQVECLALSHPFVRACSLFVVLQRQMARSCLRLLFRDQFLHIVLIYALLRVTV